MSLSQPVAEHAVDLAGVGDGVLAGRRLSARRPGERDEAIDAIAPPDLAGVGILGRGPRDRKVDTIASMAGSIEVVQPPVDGERDVAEALASAPREFLPPAAEVPPIFGGLWREATVGRAMVSRRRFASRNGQRPSRPDRCPEKSRLNPGPFRKCSTASTISSVGLSGAYPEAPDVSLAAIADLLPAKMLLSSADPGARALRA